MQGHSYYVKSVVFSPCGKQITSCGYDKTVRLWSLETEKGTFVLKSHTKEVNAAPDGRRLVLGSEDGTARFCDPEKGKSGPVCKGSIHRVSKIPLTR